jgi:hypothetical protein
MRGKEQHMRRFLVVMAMAALGTAALAQSAGAVRPDKYEFNVSNLTAELGNVCSFSVAVDFSVSGFEIDRFDASGNILGVQIHQNEQDVFSANGKTLVGLPYVFNQQVTLDSEGNVTHLYANGMVSRVPLPGGDFFLTAGRIDFILHPGETFLIQPDVGPQGNLAGFCAALSP